jgi:hypothetical protein
MVIGTRGVKPGDTFDPDLGQPDNIFTCNLAPEKLFVGFQPFFYCTYNSFPCLALFNIAVYPFLDENPFERCKCQSSSAQLVLELTL